MGLEGGARRGWGARRGHRYNLKFESGWVQSNSVFGLSKGEGVGLWDGQMSDGTRMEKWH